LVVGCCLLFVVCCLFVCWLVGWFVVVVSRHVSELRCHSNGPSHATRTSGTLRMPRGLDVSESQETLVW
jgi:hypothetical protein